MGVPATPKISSPCLNPDFLKYLFSKIDWKALIDTSRSTGSELSNEASSSMLDSDDITSKKELLFLNRQGIPHILLLKDDVIDSVMFGYFSSDYLLIDLFDTGPLEGDLDCILVFRVCKVTREEEQ
ncbi:Multifunctional methyltransferase subunit [Parasponia andersonii]|uniref:Multifunctional methyltransferase subunit n=1 Tax=Parasponia andersonii TaxID=3476 RepID=A0A2P5D1Y0_PARAD|nr:Multifunctional methyltransferase subunit [Parasponia andersonii]